MPRNKKRGRICLTPRTGNHIDHELVHIGIGCLCVQRCRKRDDAENEEEIFKVHQIYFSLCSLWPFLCL